MREQYEAWAVRVTLADGGSKLRAKVYQTRHAADEVARNINDWNDSENDAKPVRVRVTVEEIADAPK